MDTDGFRTHAQLSSESTAERHFATRHRAQFSAHPQQDHNPMLASAVLRITSWLPRSLLESAIRREAVGSRGPIAPRKGGSSAEGHRFPQKNTRLKLNNTERSGSCQRARIVSFSCRVGCQFAGFDFRRAVASRRRLAAALLSPGAPRFPHSLLLSTFYRLLSRRQAGGSPRRILIASDLPSTFIYHLRTFHAFRRLLYPFSSRNEERIARRAAFWNARATVRCL